MVARPTDRNNFATIIAIIAAIATATENDILVITIFSKGFNPYSRFHKLLKLVSSGLMMHWKYSIWYVDSVLRLAFLPLLPSLISNVVKELNYHYFKNYC